MDTPGMYPYWSSFITEQYWASLASSVDEAAAEADAPAVAEAEVESPGSTLLRAALTTSFVWMMSSSMS
jgi:hypothetical protein